MGIEPMIRAWELRHVAATTLSIVFVVIFILQIVLILITWLSDWVGRVSGVELHVRVSFIGIPKKLMAHSVLGRGAGQLFRW
jgi:phage-related holin